MQIKSTKPSGAPSDHLANERTFLAWIRTSIAMMGFGFVVVKFALFVKQIGLAVHTSMVEPASRGYSSVIGIFLVMTGVLMSIYAYVRYRITEQQLSSGVYKPSYWLAVIVTVLLLLAGIALVIYLIPNI